MQKVCIISIQCSYLCRRVCCARMAHVGKHLTLAAIIANNIFIRMFLQAFGCCCCYLFFSITNYQLHHHHHHHQHHRGSHISIYNSTIGTALTSLRKNPFIRTLCKICSLCFSLLHKFHLSFHNAFPSTVSRFRIDNNNNNKCRLHDFYSSSISSIHSSIRSHLVSS